MPEVVRLNTNRRDLDYYEQKFKTAFGKSVAGFIEAGQTLIDAKGSVGHGEYIELVENRLRIGRTTAFRLTKIAEKTVLSNVAHGQHLPPSWRTLYELTKLPDETLEARLQDSTITASIERKQVINLIKAEKQAQAQTQTERNQNNNTTENDETASIITLEEWNRMSKRDKQQALQAEGQKGLNKQSNESIGWAKWSWNPITGCLHNCPYCYARDIAERFYDGYGFAPTLHPDRLNAPQNQTIPESDDVAMRNVFTGSMADMFGRWVPEEWIEAVMQSVERSPNLNFLFLTKFPKRMIDRNVPRNVWLGATVDKQSRVRTVEDAFAQVPAHTRWLSLEPLLEPLTFNRPELFKWVVIGGASQSSQTPNWNPPFEWVSKLYRQFKDAGAAVYFKTNIGFDGNTVPREFPWQVGVEQTLPREFNYRGNQ